MKLKYSIISVFLLGLFAFMACDKVEEPFFKPLETDRNVLAEFIADAATLDETTYNEFVTLSNKDRVIPVLVLAGDTSVNGNSEAANTLVEELGVNTNESIVLFNRVSKGNKDTWQNNMDASLAKKGAFTMGLDGEVKNGRFAGSVKVKSLNGYSEAVTATVYITESNLMVNSIAVSNVLRKTEFLKSFQSLERGVGKDIALDFELPAVQSIEDVKILVVLQDKASKEVLQVAEKTLSVELTFNKKQKVLIEDFTGSRCLNCPKAHRELTNLLGFYEEQLVGIAIHYGFFALPIGEDFKTDFRTEVGNAIGEAFLGTASLPKGLVNRIGDGSPSYFEYGAWGAQVSDLVNQDAKVGIAFSAEIADNNINADIYVKGFESIDNSLKVQAFITESNIVSPQVDGAETVMDYVHNHVLRASMNGNWGEDLVDGTFAKDQIVNKTLTMPVSSDWNPEHLALVVIVYDDVTKQILQVEEKHLH